MKDKNVLVVGFQASGISAKELLASKGAKVYVYDDRIFPIPRAELDEILKKIELIVISPAIPNEHYIVTYAKEHNIQIISELELGSRYLKCPIIAITGTNGKTTTVGMIEKLLKIMGKSVMTMGNIGYPVTQVIVDGIDLDYAIIEASSFQLEYLDTFKPKYSAILNIAPDHLDRYKQYKDYVNAKKMIYKNCDKNDCIILNYDYKLLAEIAQEIEKDKKGTVQYVSAKDEVGQIYVKDNYYYINKEPLINVRDSKIKGEHNRFNFMVAMNIGLLLGAKKEHLIALIKEYNLLPHRVEYVCTLNNINYYNDSKGTNISACKTAIEAIDGKIGLILGGYDKGEEFCEFFEEIDGKVEFVAVTGANSEKIVSSAQKIGFMNIAICASLESAVEALQGFSKIDNILFSPASASFDRYKNYQERGDRFKEIVYATKI